MDGVDFVLQHHLSRISLLPVSTSCFSSQDLWLSPPCHEGCFGPRRWMMACPFSASCRMCSNMMSSLIPSPAQPRSAPSVPKDVNQHQANVPQSCIFFWLGRLDRSKTVGHLKESLPIRAVQATKFFLSQAPWSAYPCRSLEEETRRLKEVEGAVQPN